MSAKGQQAIADALHRSPHDVLHLRVRIAARFIAGHIAQQGLSFQGQTESGIDARHEECIRERAKAALAQADALLRSAVEG